MTATVLRYTFIVVMSFLVACQAPTHTLKTQTASLTAKVPPVAMAPEPGEDWFVAIPVIDAVTPQVLSIEPTDLWGEIRNNFQLDHTLQDKRVQQEIRWLTDHPQYLLNLKPRMERYLAYIHNQVLDRNLPGELALLPIIESALDPYAFSPGGAAGLWQFMPATARRFGLDRN
ncbi:MAG: transglycosylase SLT domain-containing protein, partial [Pseudomonadales bacterium]